MQLAEKPHIGRALRDDFVLVDTRGQEARARFLLELAEQTVDRLGRARRLEPYGMAAHLLEGKGRRQKSEGGGSAGRGWNQHFSQAENAGHTRRMGGARPAKADHRVAAWILALLDDVNARGRGHALGDRAMDAGGGFEG